MKRKLLLFTAVAGFGYVTLSSYAGGPAANSQGNRAIPGTSNNNCSGSGGCHGPNVAATTVNFTATGPKADSQKYVPGQNYTLIFSVPTVGGKYGFQFTAVDASNAEAGTLTLASTTQPIHIVDQGGSFVKLVEHTAALTSIQLAVEWNAPAAGTGPVTFAAIINNVNANGIADANDHPFTWTYTLTEGMPLSVSELSSNIKITAFPNPVTENFSLKFDDADAGTYEVSIYDMNGRRMHSESLNVGQSATMRIQSASWASGMYLAHITKDGAQRILPVVVQ